MEIFVREDLSILTASQHLGKERELPFIFCADAVPHGPLEGPIGR